MSTGFLNKVADDVLKQVPEINSDICFVFPNRRAGVFFQKVLAQKLNKPVWMPAIRTISDLFDDFSDLTIPDPLSLIFELYQVYKDLNPAPESFDRFYVWGEMLLRDFDEVDKYLVEGPHLFNVVKAQKELENQYDYLTAEQKEALSQFWNNVEVSKASDQKTDFVRLWQVLKEVYEKFTTQLSSRGLGYEGMLCRQVIDKIQRDELQVPYSKVVIVGFNALNKSEDVLFAHLQRQGKALFYWDVDPFYMDDPMQEAGFFLRSSVKKFPAPASFTSESGFSGKKKIQLIGVPLKVGQAKYAGELAEALLSSTQKAPKDLSDVAMVLADEHMLFPMLHSLPKDVPVNITMGYPLRHTSAYNLILLLVQLQQNKRPATDEKCYFYHKEIIQLLIHPHVKFFAQHEAKKIAEEIHSKNKLFLHQDQFSIDPLLQKIFTPVDGAAELLEYLSAITLQISSKLDVKENKLEREFYFRIFRELNRLGDLLRNGEVTVEAEGIYYLVKQVLDLMKIPFEGEPLEGMQVLGMLETRCLTFKNLFILSMNEGYFPASQGSRSFIPYNLRKAFALPVPEHHDSIYAYHFYRLIQQAEQVTLMYNTQVGFSSDGEMSRFVQQVMYNDKFEVEHKILTCDLKPQTVATLTIEKDKQVMEALEFKYFKSGKPVTLSPSAINMYLSCSMKFYLRYIAGIEEPDEVQEEIDPMIFGSIFHKTLELLYQKLMKSKGSRFVDVRDKDFLYGNVDACIDEAFRNEYFKSALAGETAELNFEGRNIILRSIILKYAKRIIAEDIKHAPFEIVELESQRDKYFLELPVQVNGKESKVKIGGIIDRIDRKNGETRIIDYKTGRDERRFKDVLSLFDKDKDTNKAAFQTLLYSLIYHRKNGSNASSRLNAGLYNVRDMFRSGDDFDYRLHHGTYGKEPVENIIQYLEEFEEELKVTIEEIFDPTTPFVQTERAMNCTYCGFRNICQR